jgi:FlaA1/EpsC-like NDP-sugar epimerase
LDFCHSPRITRGSPPWVTLPADCIQNGGGLTLFSVYDGRRSLDWKKELASLTMGTLLAGMAIAGTLYISSPGFRLLYLSFVLLTYLALLVWRGLARLHLRAGNGHFQPQRRVLILGSGDAAQELTAQIQANPRLR